MACGARVRRRWAGGRDGKGGCRVCRPPSELRYFLRPMSVKMTCPVTTMVAWMRIVAVGSDRQLRVPVEHVVGVGLPHQVPDVWLVRGCRFELAGRHAARDLLPMDPDLQATGVVPCAIRDLELQRDRAAVLEDAQRMPVPRVVHRLLEAITDHVEVHGDRLGVAVEARVSRGHGPWPCSAGSRVGRGSAGRRDVDSQVRLSASSVGCCPSRSSVVQGYRPSASWKATFSVAFVPPAVSGGSPPWQLRTSPRR